MKTVSRRKRKTAVALPKDPGAAGPATRNPKLNVQTRKVLRAHYAAKYRTR